MKFFAHLAETHMPAFAAETFTTWFRRRPLRNQDVRLDLWPDTFSNNFLPTSPKPPLKFWSSGLSGKDSAASTLLRPPLYDFGMLTGESHAEQTLTAADELRQPPYHRNRTKLCLCLSRRDDHLLGKNLEPRELKTRLSAERISHQSGRLPPHRNSNAKPSSCSSAITSQC